MPSSSVAVAHRALSPSWRDAGEHEHFAQIYESDEVLVDSVADYIRAGLAADAASIVIATPEHLEALKRKWSDAGIDVEAARSRGQLTMLDAAATLSSLLHEGFPDPGKFEQIVGSLVAEAAKRYSRIVAFGEMVNLLWGRGQLDAAIALEDCWNELARRQPMMLFCAYHLHGACSSSHVVPFEAVCSKHSRIIPAESAMRLYSEDPLRVIALLQQKAAALDEQVRERERVEEELAHLAAIVTSSDDAIVSESLDGVIRSWNRGAERIFGYSASEAIGQSITLIIPDAFREEQRSMLKQIRAGKRIEHFETERVARDGSRISVSLSLSPVRNAQGTIVGASKIARDISDRRRAEHAAEQAQRRLALEAAALATLNEWSTRLWRCRSLGKGLEQMLDAVIELLGADKGNVQLCEDGSLRIAAQRGFTQAYLDQFSEVSVDDACGCARVLRSRKMETIADVETDADYAPYLDAARSAGYRALVSAPLSTSDGSVLGVVTVHFETAGRPGEASMRRLELYTRQATDFIERCRMEDALRAKERTLLQIDRRKNEFLATLAHELRNPLAPISSGLQIMKMAEREPEIIDKTRSMMERQVGVMVRLVEDVMDIGRIGQGKIDLRKQVLDANDVVREAIEACRSRMDAAGHRLVEILSATPIWVEADRVRLVQAFCNLLSNAVKYTPAAGTITVIVEQDDADAVIRIRDTGLGLAPNMISKVFELFTQVDESMDKAQGGLGIGLSLVKGLVESHGGTVVALSEGLGKGSEFVVRLPVTRAMDLLNRTL